MSDTDGHGRARTDTDWIKVRIKLLLERGGWITAKELAELMCLEARDPLREIKKRIEELRDEGCPIVSLPGKPGPGYLWVGDPEAAGAQEAVRLYEADMKSRMGRMVKHLATIKRVTERDVQMGLFREVEVGFAPVGTVKVKVEAGAGAEG